MYIDIAQDGDGPLLMDATHTHKPTLARRDMMRTTKQDSAAEDNKAVLVGSCHGVGLSMLTVRFGLPQGQRARTGYGCANVLQQASIALRCLTDL